MTPGLRVSDVHPDQNHEGDKGGSDPANDRRSAWSAEMRHRCRRAVCGLRFTGWSGQPNGLVGHEAGSRHQPVAELPGLAGHLGGASRPVGRVLGGQVRDQRPDIGRHERGQGGKGPDGVGERHLQRRPVKRGRARQALVRDHSEGIEITERGRARSGRPLGRQVPRRANDQARARHAGRAHRMRDAEVGDLHDAVRGEQQVAGLDVPVNQPRLVGRLQPGRGLRDDVHRPHGVHRPAGQCLGQ